MSCKLDILDETFRIFVRLNDFTFKIERRENIMCSKF